MSDYFYRFRPASALLEGFHELENQEIYFPTLNELNDPLEGFKDVFWRGDRIVWRNLFRHYILCVMESLSLTTEMGNKFTPDALNNLIHQTDGDLPEAPIQKIYARACDSFFDNESIDYLISSLTQTKRIVRRDELIFYLNLFHFLSLASLIISFKEEGLEILKLTEKIHEFDNDKIILLLKSIESMNFSTSYPEELFFISKNVSDEISLIREFNTEIIRRQDAWNFVIRDFPAHYVTALERLLYPDWHAACFVTDPTSASMWGHYGDGHRGVCLKFRAKPNSAGAACLDLSTPIQRHGDDASARRYMPHAFEAIEYTSQFPEVDFFQSLGRPSMSQLSRFWYRGTKGEYSEIGANLLSGNREWRANYWKQFTASYRTKLPQWSHENEHRIILSSVMGGSFEKFDRKLVYKFEDLAGVVFGIKTSMETKIAIMRIIHQKCINLRRTDFEFLQAHYSHLARQIEVKKLGLIKISMPPL